jgi:hypothetical protein
VTKKRTFSRVCHVTDRCAKLDGKPKEITWTQGSVSDPILTNITVFDSRCTRVITDDCSEIVYLPYGTDVFQKLAETVQSVKIDIQAEITNLVPIQDSAVLSATPSAIFLQTISETTRDEEIQVATAWNPDDDVRLKSLEELLRASDPTIAIQELETQEKDVSHVLRTRPASNYLAS